METLQAPLCLKVAPLELWRTLGRTLYYEEGVDINEIRTLDGLATTEQRHCRMRAVSDKMRAAVQHFDSPRPTRAATVPVGPEAPVRRAIP